MVYNKSKESSRLSPETQKSCNPKTQKLIGRVSQLEPEVPHEAVWGLNKNTKTKCKTKCVKKDSQSSWDSIFWWIRCSSSGSFQHAKLLATRFFISSVPKFNTGGRPICKPCARWTLDDSTQSMKFTQFWCSKCSSTPQWGPKGLHHFRTCARSLTD